MDHCHAWTWHLKSHGWGANWDGMDRREHELNINVVKVKRCWKQSYWSMERAHKVMKSIECILGREEIWQGIGILQYEVRDWLAKFYHMQEYARCGHVCANILCLGHICVIHLALGGRTYETMTPRNLKDPLSKSLIALEIDPYHASQERVSMFKFKLLCSVLYP